MASYEWVLETLDTHGEITDVDHSNRPQLAQAFMDVGLVVDRGNGERAWAYSHGTKLPDVMVDAYDVVVCKVPKRYRDQWARYIGGLDEDSVRTITAERTRFRLLLNGWKSSDVERFAIERTFGPYKVVATKDDDEGLVFVVYCTSTNDILGYYSYKLQDADEINSDLASGRYIKDREPGTAEPTYLQDERKSGQGERYYSASADKVFQSPGYPEAL